MYPAAELPQIAKDSGAFIVEINPDPAFAYAHAHLIGSASTVLPLLVDAVRRIKNGEEIEVPISTQKDSTTDKGKESTEPEESTSSIAHKEPEKETKEDQANNSEKEELLDKKDA